MLAHSYAEGTLLREDKSAYLTITIKHIRTFADDLAKFDREKNKFAKQVMDRKKFLSADVDQIQETLFGFENWADDFQDEFLTFYAKLTRDGLKDQDLPNPMRIKKNDVYQRVLNLEQEVARWYGSVVDEMFSKVSQKTLIKRHA